ncbi:tetratricopeptide repeat protein [Pinirhizobacter soli]|uniref:tetratricopeptide repeat protein n=1 Tax=Pinirhizobacter soli TaxID=2786953 RepID=UPI00202A6C91|nr:tetratricopeptide repeat protein [Pinirhizobacter soli]
MESMRRFYGLGLFIALMILAVLIYLPGLRGGFIFDDFPNIVDNTGVQPSHFGVGTLVSAALSSPASDFKRPIASLSFALNFLGAGMDPFWMKVTNLVLHLLNGLVAWLLLRRLFVQASMTSANAAVVAAIVSGGWLLLPINLTAVVYVVQRMESMANLAVLIGLWGYVVSRQRTIYDGKGQVAAWLWIGLATGIGVLAKETAVMLPVYALIIELIFFGFRRRPVSPPGRDKNIIALYLVLLALPTFAGLAWLLPRMLDPAAWQTRDFTLAERLYSELRIVADYVKWTFVPQYSELSFYHDNFKVSTGLLAPVSTAMSAAFLLAMMITAWIVRRRAPLVTLGITWYFACHLLTATILPLELVYEHRNYFASLGLLVAAIPMLCDLHKLAVTDSSVVVSRPLRYGGPGIALLLMTSWSVMTAVTAEAWSNPLKLAEELALRAIDSPRAQYELGRTYIIYSNYDPKSPFTKLAYAPLERAAAIPGSSILAEQALIFMNARMKLSTDPSWWDSMLAKLRARPATVQDDSSMIALATCVGDDRCDLPNDRMTAAFEAVLSHPGHSARVLGSYGTYVWNETSDHNRAISLTRQAVERDPREPAYRISLVQMLIEQGERDQAREALGDLGKLNVGGRLDPDLARLKTQLARAGSSPLPAVPPG